jgi:UDP-N-acetylglucosamine transferase subunit ALG13
MEEFDKLLDKAELIILHAGVSVIQAIRAGKTPVVMPRRTKYGEIVVDHQWEFARALAETGKIIVADESGDLPAAVAEALKRQSAHRPTATVPPLVGMIGEVLRKYDIETKEGR